MHFLLGHNTPLERPADVCVEPARAAGTKYEHAVFAGRLADFFEGMIFTFAQRCDSAGDRARRALLLMGPGGDRKKGARMLQPFAVGFSNWLRSEEDLLTIEIPPLRKPRRLRQ